MLTIQGYIDLINDRSPESAKLKRRWEDVYYGMSLHIDGACPSFISLSGGGVIYPPNYFGVKYQYIFENLLLSKHPRENKDTLSWRLSQYRSWTKEPFSRVISFIRGSIFQDSNYYLKVSDEAMDDYVWGDNVNGEPFIMAVSKHIKNIFSDPNGVLAVIPKKDSYNDSELLRSEIQFVYSKDVILLNDDEFVFKKDDNEAWVINRLAGYIRFVKNKGGKFVLSEGYYGEEFDVLPCVRAGGIWNERGYYDSWLDGAKAIADEYVSTKSAEQLVNKEASHPFIIAASEECPDCAGGTVQVCGVCNHKSNDCSCETIDHMNYKLVSCNSCGGSGLMSRNPADWLIAPKEDMDKRLLQIVNPDVSINDFHLKFNQNLYDHLISALHLSWIDKAQSGIAKERDAETRYQFVSSISNDIFCRIIPVLLKGVIKIAGGNDDIKSIISKPTQFSIKTSNDLLLEYQLSTQAKMPDYIRAKHLMEYTDKQFGGDYAMIKKVDVIIQLDKFAVSTEEEIQMSVEGGAATRRDWQFHRDLPTMIDELIRDYGRIWFLNPKTSIDKIKLIIDNKFVNLLQDVTTEENQSNVSNQSYGRNEGSITV